MKNTGRHCVWTWEVSVSSTFAVSIENRTARLTLKFEESKDKVNQKNHGISFSQALNCIEHATPIQLSVIEPGTRQEKYMDILLVRNNKHWWVVQVKCLPSNVELEGYYLEIIKVIDPLKEIEIYDQIKAHMV